MKVKKNFQKGISLLEVLLSLTIIAIILVMAVRYFFVAENNNRINTTRQDIGSLIAAVNSWKGRNPQYTSNLSIKTLVDEGELTLSNSLTTAGVLYNPWGQEITMTIDPASVLAAVTIATPLPDNNDCVQLNNSYPAAICDGSGKFSLSFS